VLGYGDRLSHRVDSFTDRVDNLTERVDGLSQSVGKLSGDVDKLGFKFDASQPVGERLEARRSLFPTTANTGAPLA
jgi:hypothetical protein